MGEPLQLTALIETVNAGGTLSADEMQFALEQMTAGALPPADMGAFLLRLRERG